MQGYAHCSQVREFAGHGQQDTLKTEHSPLSPLPVQLLVIDVNRARDVCERLLPQTANPGRAHTKAERKMRQHFRKHLRRKRVKAPLTTRGYDARHLGELRALLLTLA
eukprot:36512-Rhodomonas_salina.1